MKIWFDISNSPHINMFRAMINELQKEHDVVITCRPLANTVDLLDLHKLDHTVVGVHYGKSLAKKTFGYPIRVVQLAKFLSGKKIDVAISQSSFHSPLVARLLGVRSIYLNDNEYAVGNIPAFAFATRIMVPEFFRTESLNRQYASERKVLRYPGVKEGIYLWESSERIRKRRDARLGHGQHAIFVRPEPWTAQYYHGAHNFLDSLLIGIKDNVRVSILPRSKEQENHYKGHKFAGVMVVDNARDVEEIAPECDLFIGAGGTMTREMAVLGIPTISVYQDSLLDVDRYLLTKGAFLHRPALTAGEALSYLDSSRRRTPDLDLLQKGRKAYQMIKQAIFND